MTTKNDIRNRKKRNSKEFNEEIKLENIEKKRKEKKLSKYVIFFIFIFRVFNALSIKTYFQADEYYQSLEPAHYMVFNYGYITWEWKEKLRSSIHPIIYAIGYKLIVYFSNDPKLIIITPKVISSIIATIGEYYTYKFAKAFTKNEHLSRVTLALSLLSSFNWFFITRSFSNGFEMVLTTIAFSYWPWDSKLNRKFYLGAAFAFLSCIVRPTNCLIWLYLGIILLINLHKNGMNILQITRILSILLVELIAVGIITTASDTWFYGKLTFPLYNFIEFNVLKNLSIFYGMAPWHFYIFQGVPLILMTYLPFFLYSLVKLQYYKNLLGQVGLFVVIGFSLIDHKEIRFIYTLMPVFLLLTADAFLRIARSKYFRLIMITGVVLNSGIAYFLTQVNERGVIDVINYLRDNKSDIESFGFLTPCHSTPWQSQLHSIEFNSSSWFLTCEPPLHLHHATKELISSYRDESDQFYDDPIKFLETRFPPLNSTENLIDKHQSPTQPSKVWPSRLIIFEPLEHLIESHLSSHYVQCQRFFNSYIHWDSRRTGDIIVYCLI